MIVMTPEKAKSICDVFYLALVTWREARGASYEAKVAVAFSVMNRVTRPSWWGHTLGEVVTKKWQYSSIGAPNDPQLLIWPLLSDSSWMECLDIAACVILGQLANPMPGADSYYDSSISAPKWAMSDFYVGQISSPHGNALRFYDVDQDYEKLLTGHA